MIYDKYRGKNTGPQCVKDYIAVRGITPKYYSI
jgi:hypothetical protein